MLKARYEKIPLWLRLYLMIFRMKKIGINRDGLEFYIFKCNKHGIMIDYLRGQEDYDGYLICNICKREAKEKSINNNNIS
jgi:hypothetical protein